MADLDVSLSADELALLRRMVETVLGDTRVEVHRTHQPAYREQVKDEEACARVAGEAAAGGRLSDSLDDEIHQPATGDDHFDDRFAGEQIGDFGVGLAAASIDC